MAVATEKPETEEINWDDATWIFLASFLIFTMQTGFALLEVGVVAPKNEVNILMKNLVDIILGGFSYWIVGYGLSFGTDPGSNPFNGVGFYAVNPNLEDMGVVFTSFLFQLSFATTSTTIVSGAVAERCNYSAYCLFSLLSTFTYVFPARWIWGPSGFLGDMGVIDIAGSGAVHLVGASSAVIACYMIGPRVGRYENGIDSLPLGNPSSCIYGLFNLWWGWLAFNAGSTYGVTGPKWKFAARAAVTTMISAIGGGLIGTIYAFIKQRTMLVLDVVNPVLGALVGITASCAVVSSWESFIIGVISAIICILTSSWMDRLGIDDAVGATPVHGFCGIWGMLAVGFFTSDDGGAGFVKGYVGLFHGGSAYLFGVQLLACVCVIIWSSISTFIIFTIIRIFVHIRMEEHEQLIGADLMEHYVRRHNAGVTPAVSVYGDREDVMKASKKAQYFGATNPKHDAFLAALKRMGQLPHTANLKKQRGIKLFTMNIAKRFKKSALEKEIRSDKKLNNQYSTTKIPDPSCVKNANSNACEIRLSSGHLEQRIGNNVWNQYYIHQYRKDSENIDYFKPEQNRNTINWIQNGYQTRSNEVVDSYLPHSYRIFSPRNRFNQKKQYSLLD